MSTRAYDFIITVDDASDFKSGNTIIGLSSGTSAEILAIEDNNLKVCLSNVYYRFEQGETVISNSSITLSSNVFIDHSANIDGTTNSFALPSDDMFLDSIQVYVDSTLTAKDKYVLNDNNTITFKPVNVLVDSNDVEYAAETFPSLDVNTLVIQGLTGNVESQSFVASNLTGYVETANSSITSIASSPYISEKNKTQQTPLVRLFSIYFPGEWYPANANGHPSGSGAGYPWPYNFPIRYAEVIGETYSDFNYSVVHNGLSYKTLALSASTISADSSSGINSITFEISNFDGNIASIVDNKNLIGYSSNHAVAYVNGEELINIDPETVYENVHYNANTVSSRGANAVLTYEVTQSREDSWISLLRDSRDLLGAVVEIKSTYAKFLDYWPEYSLSKSSSDNVITVYSTSPYRIGDTITSNSSSYTSTIEDIRGSNLYLSSSSLSSIGANNKVYIVNGDADPYAYVDNVFIIDNLQNLDELSAQFSLTSWFANFKKEIPKRKFISNICSWAYKGPECKYPSTGTGDIVGSNPVVSANGYFTYGNEATAFQSLDVCSKTFTSCALRNNIVNFGGFQSVRQD